MAGLETTRERTRVTKAQRNARSMATARLDTFAQRVRSMLGCAAGAVGNLFLRKRDLA